MSGSPPDDRRQGLRPPQFGLGGLLLVVAVLCGVLAAVNAFGLYGGFIIGILALSVFAHVAGNAIGTRLRQGGNQPLPLEGQDSAEAVRPGRSRPARDRFAPATRLRYRMALGLPIIIVTAIGAIAGGAAGGYMLLVTIKQQATLANMAIGIGAFAVLGGIWTFIGSSFLQVLGGALWQAIGGERRPD